MKKSKCLLLSGLAAGLAFLTPAAHATLLFYEGFAAEDYTAGSLDGQPIVGAGYAANSIWNTSSTFETGGLTYPNLATTDGFRLSRSAGEVIANFDLTEAGPFGTAGLIGSNGLVGGTGVSSPIYFSVLANRADTQAASFAGFNIYSGGSEGMGIGEVAGSAYSWLESGRNGAIGDPPTDLVSGETRFFVFKLEFDDANPTAAKIWMNPEPLMGEEDQDTSISTDVANAKPLDGFDSFRLRGTRIWEFDELRIGTTWEDVTPSALMAPPLIITAVGYDPETQQVTLTWDSQEGLSYSVKYSTDLTTWDLNLDNDVLGDPGDATTRTFDLTLDPDTQDAAKIFFRIETN